ncbi:MAG: NADH-ubiquinone oxidoreductase chain G [uncultured Solirubrobacteraceae bacterium]|uniref:NADH-ubiquinone oxidoreductase chain G n=1 Tax=uncultured Solirubrobacteraceae bacterium TaxID=1162706 RepID=A0A6J4U0B3_9ACTN|nr:MAG: NADH-ubiquinone oxidoreductase chain G [uncultured Solirubrobacteraceae bacterium]
MVVFTQTDRVKQAQEAVLEFLLINHPLDCPVCDKGGECPLQDISMGWGGGRSRFIEPKRHFQKPLALSPLVHIDRERCILCYRCVRFSQEVSEDYQLVLRERGAATFVSTFDGHPYVAPFSGNITELCPVGALTSRPYRFRARPWDIEQSASVCTLCPSQCNVSFTVRDERVLRVLGRDNDEVDDGWLCDKGRFAYQAAHVDERITQPMVRDGGVLRPVSWDRALSEAASALKRAGANTAAIAGGETTNEEAFLLQRLLREGLGSPHLDSSPHGSRPRDELLALADPALQATVPDLEYAHAVLVLDCEPVDDAPILDLRLRKGVRRNRMELAIATSRASSLDPNAKQVARFAPGRGGEFAQALAAAINGESITSLAEAAGATEDSVRAVADWLATAGEDKVILFGERLRNAPGILALTDAVNVSGRQGAGLLEVPASTNGRGLREAGFTPVAGPGYAETTTGRTTPEIADALANGDLTAVYLLHVDPLRTLPDRAAWDRALGRATTVIAHAAFLTEGLRAHANVVFPQESHAEKEGTVVHPDGRLQRVRPAIAHQGENRFEWQVIADVAAQVGLELAVLTGGMVTQQLVAAVPFYAGLTHDVIGVRGVRWHERDEASAFPSVPSVPAPSAASTPPAQANGRLRLGAFRSIWAAPEVEASPALKFLAHRRLAELSPDDAKRLGIADGAAVEVGANGTRVAATAAVRADAPAGTVFLEEDLANALSGTDLVEVTPS